MGMRISALVIVSISVMMVVAILPVYAHLGSDDELFKCPNKWESVELFEESDSSLLEVDKNGNFHICKKVAGDDKIILKDDHQLGKNKP